MILLRNLVRYLEITLLIVWVLVIDPILSLWRDEK